MPKTIKLSDEQIKNYVKNIIEEQVGDDELQLNADAEKMKHTVPGGTNLTLAKDKNGKYYVIKDAYTDNPVLIYQEP